MDRIYCHPCWLFSHENFSAGTSYALQKPSSTTVLNDWRHLWQRIQSHESATHHAEACAIYEQWRNRGTIEEALYESLLEKNILLTKCFEKLVNVTLMLAKCNQSFRGSSEKLLNDNKDNFLFIVQLLAKYDPVFDKLLQLLKGSPKYLSPLIRNELISVLAEEVLHDWKSELQSAPFLSLFLIPLKMSAKKTSQVKYLVTSKSITTIMERHHN